MALTRTGLVKVTFNVTRPRYYIVPAHEVPGVEGYPPPPMDVEEQTVFSRISAGFCEVPKTVSPKRNALEHEKLETWKVWCPQIIADRLVTKGHARRAGIGTYQAIPYDAEVAATPDWIWLPNAIIDGAGVNAASPVELIRQAQNLTALHLFIDMYHAQNLTDDGGVHWRTICRNFDRSKVWEHGQFTIFGFDPGALTAWGTKPLISVHMTGTMEKVGDRTQDKGWTVFWSALNLIVNLGLVEIVNYVIEFDADAAEILMPYAIDNGMVEEQAVATSAQLVAELMVQEMKQPYGATYLVPVLRHQSDVQMVGIARLRYRARTSATSRCLARMSEWREVAQRFDEIAEELQTVKVPSEARRAHF
jgi:hypothetical protein